MERNQSSAPWLHPPITLCNTDGWKRTRKTTSKITVRSAKKQERLKKKTWNAKPKCYWVWPQDTFSLPSWPWMLRAVTGLSAASRAPLPLHLHHPVGPPGRSVAPEASQARGDVSGGRVSSARRRVWRWQSGLCQLQVWGSPDWHERRRNVEVIIMAPADTSESFLQVCMKSNNL